MAVWGLGVINNVINWGRGAFNNLISWGIVQKTSPAGDTEIYGVRQDSNVTAFLSVTGITDTTIISALDTLATELKSYGIFDKMKAIYPFVGGTATTHKFNLVNSADTNGAFRLAFNGGWTHDANGATPNGTNGYADTFLVANGNLGLNSTHVSAYSRTDTNKEAPAIANAIGGAGGEVSMWLKYLNLMYLRVNNGVISSTANTNSTGYFIGNRISSTQLSIFKNNTKTTFNQNSNSLSSTSFRLSNYGVFYDNKQLAFVTIGDGLTDTEASNLYIAVQKFQSTLGRNI